MWCHSARSWDRCTWLAFLWGQQYTSCSTLLFCTFYERHPPGRGIKKGSSPGRPAPHVCPGEQRQAPFPPHVACWKEREVDSRPPQLGAFVQCTFSTTSHSSPASIHDTVWLSKMDGIREKWARLPSSLKICFIQMIGLLPGGTLTVLKISLVNRSLLLLKRAPNYTPFQG